jgi:peptidoglycan/xylan/chitin deacetylase (PgdA/CDA1 family)
VVPYAYDVNDFKFTWVNGFVTGAQFYNYLVDSFDQLYEEGGRMMSVGLHCRILGRPGRVGA